MATHAPVHNARQIPPKAFYTVTHLVAKRMEPRVARAFMQAVKNLQKGISLTALRQAISSGDTGALRELIGSRRIQAVIMGDPVLLNALTRTTIEAGRGTAEVLRRAGFPASFDARDPLVTIAARRQGAQLAVGLTAGARETIRIVTALGNELGLTVAQQAEALRAVVGLPPNWVQAPINFGDELRRGVVNSGRLLGTPRTGGATTTGALWERQLRNGIEQGRNLDEGWIERQQQRYADNLTRRRALNIARTETLRAANGGQLEAWRQAIRSGALPSNVRKVWIVTPDYRLSPEHAQIPGMNVGGRRLDEPFVTPDGNFMQPPSRPNCRCGISLLIPPPERRRGRVSRTAAREGPPPPRRRRTQLPALPPGSATPARGAQKWIAELDKTDALLDETFIGDVVDRSFGVHNFVYNVSQLHKSDIGRGVTSINLKFHLPRGTTGMFDFRSGALYLDEQTTLLLESLWNKMKARGAGLALTRDELHAFRTLLHELVHSQSRLRIGQYLYEEARFMEEAAVEWTARNRYGKLINTGLKGGAYPQEYSWANTLEALSPKSMKQILSKETKEQRLKVVAKIAEDTKKAVVKNQLLREIPGVQQALDNALDILKDPRTMTKDKLPRWDAAMRFLQALGKKLRKQTTLTPWDIEEIKNLASEVT